MKVFSLITLEDNNLILVVLYVFKMIIIYIFTYSIKFNIPNNHVILDMYLEPCLKCNHI